MGFEVDSLSRLIEILPHRNPILMLDRVVSLDHDSIVAEKDLPQGHHVFDGHFPGNPVMPGVFMLEAIAQAGAVLGMLRFFADKKGLCISKQNFQLNFQVRFQTRAHVGPQEYQVGFLKHP